MRISWSPVKAVTEADRTEVPEITEVRRRTIMDSYEFRYQDLVPIPVRTKRLTHLNLNICFEKVAKHNKIHTYVNNVL